MAKTLGQRVAEKRAQRGFTQKELAEAIRQQFPYFKGGQSTIQAIESGQSKNPTIIFELARALHCSEMYLKTGVEGPADRQARADSLARLEKEMEQLLEGPRRPPGSLPGALPPELDQEIRFAEMKKMEILKTTEILKEQEKEDKEQEPQSRASHPVRTPFLNRESRRQAAERQAEGQEEQSGRVRAAILRFTHAVLGSYEMLGLTKEEGIELLEIVTDAAEGPLPDPEGMDELQSRRMLAWNNTRRFLQAKHAKNR